MIDERLWENFEESFKKLMTEKQYEEKQKEVKAVNPVGVIEEEDDDDDIFGGIDFDSLFN